MTDIKTLADVVGNFQAIAKELGDNKTAHDNAAKDFGDRLRAVEVRAAFANKSEARPDSNTADMIARYAPSGQVVLRSVTRTIQFAGMNVEVEHEGLFFGNPSTEWDADLKRLALGRTIYRMATGRPTPKLDGMILAQLAKAPTANGFRDAVAKAISDTATSGAEWIPDIPISTLYEDFYLPNGIAELFPTMAVSGPILVPKITDNFRPYIKGKVSNNDPSQYTVSEPVSDSQTIDPVGFAVRALIDDAATEDAIIPLLPEIQRRMGRAVIDGYEDCMVNGDTAATHQDAIAAWNIRSRWGAAGLGGTADHRRGFLGLRPIAADRSHTVDLTASQTASGVMGSVVGAMGERAGSDIALITSPEVLYKKLMIDPNVLTIEKFGPKATIVTGQLAAIGGHPLVVSRWLSADLETSGLFLSAGTKSGLLAVDRMAWTHYQVRSALVETEKDITRGAYNVVGTLRRTFRTLSGSSAPVSYFAYNMG